MCGNLLLQLSVLLPLSVRRVQNSKPMASLAHAIHGFQNGNLSHHEFLEQVDRLLATDRANSARLQDLLSDESTRVLLPPVIYDELRSRVDDSFSPHASSGTNGTNGTAHTVMHGHERDRDRSTSDSISPGSWLYSFPTGEPQVMKGIGDTLNGRFVLEECIGFGGMGVVYKALDLRKLEASDRNPYIAIKVLNVQFRGHPKSLIALQREAKKAQSLAHPNIVTVYDFDRDGSTVYLTMEYLSGEPLSLKLRNPDFKGMPLSEALPIVTGMARALAYAHERGFVHCDFKPANVILTDSGQVKVIDFGIARAFRKPAHESEATVFDPGSLGGLTPAYASPEMLEHREPDPRDDIYALACITYELLTGHHPFDRLAATQAKNAGMKPQRPKNLGHRQWHALKDALSLERETRTPTVTRLLQELSEQDRAWGKIALAASAGACIVALALVGGNYWESWSEGDSGQESTANSTQGTPEAARPPPALTAAAVEQVLASVPCSALVTSVNDNALEVQGYLPASFGATRVKEMLGGMAGGRAVLLNVQQVSEEKCGVIKLFAPYWKQSRQVGSSASLHTKPRNAPLMEGDALVLDLATPGYDSYVNVDYYAFDGGVVHMVPSPRLKANQAPPNYAATIGGSGNWVIAKPLGTDLIVLLVTPAPLFDKLRPESEHAADYLQAVEKQLGQMANKYGPEKIAVDFLQITTHPRKS